MPGICFAGANALIKARKEDCMRCDTTCRLLVCKWYLYLLMKISCCENIIAMGIEEE